MNNLVWLLLLLGFATKIHADEVKTPETKSENSTVQVELPKENEKPEINETNERNETKSKSLNDDKVQKRGLIDLNFGFGDKFDHSYFIAESVTTQQPAGISLEVLPTKETKETTGTQEIKEIKEAFPFTFPPDFFFTSTTTTPAPLTLPTPGYSEFLSGLSGLPQPGGQSAVASSVQSKPINLGHTTHIHKTITFYQGIPEPYPVIKHVPVPVEKHIPVPIKVPVPVPVPVEKTVHVPVKVPVKVAVPVPQPYPVVKEVHVPVKVFVDKPYPVFVHDHHDHHHHDHHDHHHDFHDPHNDFHDSHHDFHGHHHDFHDHDDFNHKNHWKPQEISEKPQELHENPSKPIENDYPEWAAPQNEHIHLEFDKLHENVHFVTVENDKFYSSSNKVEQNVKNYKKQPVRVENERKQMYPYAQRPTNTASGSTSGNDKINSQHDQNNHRDSYDRHRNPHRDQYDHRNRYDDRENEKERYRNRYDQNNHGDYQNYQKYQKYQEHQDHKNHGNRQDYLIDPRDQNVKSQTIQRNQRSHRNQREHRAIPDEKQKDELVLHTNF